MEAETLKKMVAFRKELHQHPELAGHEEKTAQRVIDFVKNYNPDEIISHMGGAGVAFVYHGAEEGDTVLLRADLDGVPIEEANPFSHQSLKKGVSHKCGHDGHMAILAGVAAQLSARPIKKGTLVLLFQPAEETGQGAKRVIEDEKFHQIWPDYVFALHNLPGFPEHAIAIKDDNITIASTGMKIGLLGKSAHAQSPEDGISPVEAIKTIHSQIQQFHKPVRESENFSLITTVGMRVGSEDYGVAPAQGELFLTVRAYQNEVLDRLLRQIETVSNAVAASEMLQVSFSYKDHFRASVNDAHCVRIVKEAAGKCHLKIIDLNRGLGISEDFGRFIEIARKGGAFFILGAGEGGLPIHTPEYDFNDALIESGVALFDSIVHHMLGSK